MFLPETIDLGHSEKYILSIRINPGGFMFSISDPEDGTNYCLRETSFLISDDLLSNVQRIIFELNFLTQEFKQTNVIFVSKDYDLVPAAYYDAKEKTRLYDFTRSRKSNYIVSGIIEKQDIITLFSPDKEIVEFLSRNLWSPRFFHHTNLLINFFENKTMLTGDTSRMYLNFHGHFLDVICFSGQKLIHSLTYENEPLMNQLYFILKLWEQCGFNQQEDHLYIVGKPEKQLVKLLQEYIKQIEQSNTPSEIFLWNEDAQKAPLDLLTLSL
ncbi:MAG: DUF3822 family protein [Prevotella sp.]|jgi:hypothetical protein|nr:DUF3822 family protein [Prevotella sp.]